MWISIVFSAVRHILTAAGAVIVENGWSSQDDLTSAVGAVVTIIGFALSVVSNRKKSKELPWRK